MEVDQVDGPKVEEVRVDTSMKLKIGVNFYFY
jgi:hypothetical protein